MGSEIKIRDRNGLRERVVIIDEIRGLFILLMVIFHYIYDIMLVYGRDIFEFPFVNVITKMGASVFVLISGLSSNFSRGNKKRGIKVLLIAILISIITGLFDMERIILFGVLHMLGVSMILIGILERKISELDKRYYKVIIIGSILIFLLTINIYDGFLGLYKFRLELPKMFYRKKYLFMFGFPDNSFHSGDYFPLIPWFFLFLAGYVVGKTKTSYPRYMFKTRSKILSLAGKKTLIIYLFHQPLFYFLKLLYSVSKA